jgi:hypothetical protein
MRAPVYAWLELATVCVRLAGLGFTDRSHAFDFNAALQDFRREVNGEKERAEEPVDTGPKVCTAPSPRQPVDLGRGGNRTAVSLGGHTEVVFTGAPLRRSICP